MNKIETSLTAVNGSQDYAIVTGKADLFQYENGKRISDERIGIKINVVLQGNRLSSLSIKIEGKDPLPNVTDEQIIAACAAKKFIYAKFTDCKITLYTMNGTMGMTAVAKNVELLDTSSK